MTSQSSVKEMTRIGPWHLGHVRGSTFLDQVRDRLESSVSALPSSCGILWMVPQAEKCVDTRGTLEEGVFDQNPSDGLAMIEVLGPQPLTTRTFSRHHKQGIPE